MSLSEPDSWTHFRENFTWESADGKRYLVRDIADSHLVNILNWVAARPKQYPSTIYEMFEEEAKFRKTLCFVNNLPVPTKQDNGTWELII